jgi:hypothetical protein
MNRRELLKSSLATGLLAVVAPELILPERKLWQLDQTMVMPKTHAPFAFGDRFLNIPQHFQHFQYSYDGWNIYHEGPEETGAPYDHYRGFHTQGGNFTLRIDRAATFGQSQRWSEFHARELATMMRTYGPHDEK